MARPTAMKIDERQASAVRAQLDRCLRSKHLCAAPLLTRFLRFVVEQTLAGQADLLNERAIAVHVFGEKQDFDPQKSSRVRVAANRLRLVLKIYQLDEGRCDPVIIAMQPRSYVAEFLCNRACGDGRAADL